MKTLAVLTAVMLALAPVAQASAGPLREVPASHWAYDAVAELTTMGLVEGYPVSAFRGDRAITRYEMAVVVARVLARLDAARVPAPPPPLATVHRLVTEFRVELQALGIRIGAVEGALAGLWARTAGPQRAGVIGTVYDFSLTGSLRGSITLGYADPLLQVGRSLGETTSSSLIAEGYNSGVLFHDAVGAKGGGRLSMPAAETSPTFYGGTLGEGGSADWQLASWTGGSPPLGISSGSAWGLDIGGRSAEGRRAFADWATLSNIPSLAATPPAGVPSVQISAIVDLARFGISTWSASLDLGYRSTGSRAIVGLSPVHHSAAFLDGQDYTWTTRGWLARLNLSFTPRTTGSILYERGSVIPTGQPYAEWALRMAHLMATNTTVSLNYYRTSCGIPGGTPCPGFAAAGEIDRLYRAELLYSW